MRLFLLALLLPTVVTAGTATIITDAEYHVQRNGVEQFCALHVAVNGGTLNFTGDCGTPPPPAGLYASGRLSYGGRGGFISNANLLDWSVMWGRSGVEGQPVLFPGASGATPVWTPGRGQYTCSKFHTSAAGSVTGQVKNSRYYSASTVDISYSRSCGDFSASLGAKCYVTGVINNEQPVLASQVGGISTFRCVLPPNADVFENIRRTSPTAGGAISVIGQQG